jgi:hypothetical protein
MHHEPASLLGGRQCECGAVAQHGSSLCRKCGYRARWYRRRARDHRF